MKITLQRFLYVRRVFPSKAKRALKAEIVTSVDIVKTPSIHLRPKQALWIQRSSAEKNYKAERGRDGFRQEHMTFIPVIGRTVDVN